MMDFMFADPLMLDDLDYLFKCDVARKLMFYHQSKYQPPPPVDKSNVSFFYRFNFEDKLDLRYNYVKLQVLSR